VTWSVKGDKESHGINRDDEMDCCRCG
jgi:hypothetical protein